MRTGEGKPRLPPPCLFKCLGDVEHVVTGNEYSNVTPFDGADLSRAGSFGCLSGARRALIYDPDYKMASPKTEDR